MLKRLWVQIQALETEWTHNFLQKLHCLFEKTKNKQKEAVDAPLKTFTYPKFHLSKRARSKSFFNLFLFEKTVKLCAVKEFFKETISCDKFIL